MAAARAQQPRRPSRQAAWPKKRGQNSVLTANKLVPAWAWGILEIGQRCETVHALLGYRPAFGHRRRQRPVEDAMDCNLAHLDKSRDIVDQLIDLMLNYRQSGHPGGSRSKAQALLTLLLSGAMRWDIRRPDKPLADRFVLIAGHTVPVVYALLALFSEALRLRHAETGDAKYLVKHGDRWQVTWRDLMELRNRHGLPGHAEFAGKTLFFKANTGPSGHGFPPAVGMAFALKRAGAGHVRVFAVEGEGGATAGAAHESANSAWGLGLDNLTLLLDWNDFGIDPRPHSSVVFGTPQDWFGGHGWRVYGAEDGTDYAQLSSALGQALDDPDKQRRPACVWFRTRKGRGYGKFDAPSHGSPHKTNSPEFWATKAPFEAKWGVQFVGSGAPPPADKVQLHAQRAANFEVALSVLRNDPTLYRYLADRLVEIGDSVPEGPLGSVFETTQNPWQDPQLFDFASYPEKMWVKPGESVANRQGLHQWGSWANSWAKQHYGRPLFMALSADLAESTSIAGFAKPFGEMPNDGWYERDKSPQGVLLPQEITEFTNSGMSAGIASVNFSATPEEDWNGFGAAHSTYGSFSYLGYGPMRLYSQVIQDCEFKVGPVLWIASHSGPETAEDSRTHFGIYEPAVTQLFPEDHVCDLHPWEPNEVPVAIAEALRQGYKIIALHLTRPNIVVPDRAALGMPSHFAAAKGAYVLRPYRIDQPRGGTVVVQGTMSTYNVVRILGELDRRNLNVKIVAAMSPQLFARQPQAYRDSVLSAADKVDAMAITNRSRDSMRRWLGHDEGLQYTLCADFDDRWRTGGSVDEIIAEAHLDQASILAGIERFVLDRDARLARLSTLAQLAAQLAAQS